LSELLDEIAAKTPAPGGGSSSAWATAIAAALTEMAASFAGQDTARARELRARALELAEQELTAYAPVLEAMRLPKDDPTRTEKLGRALADAADSPLEIARVA